jgi:hypothetical protein
LTAEQREGIAKTPLAGLLSLGNVQIRRKFCKKVADTYDTEWHGFVFNGRILHIHLQDVANILGLPWEGGEPNLEDINPKDDTERARARKKEELYQLYKDGAGSAITYDGLVRQIKQEKGSTDEHFIRRFTLCAICRLLCPTSKYTVSAKYLWLMVELEDMDEVNWSRLTLDFLMDGIKEYRTRGRVNLYGNLPLLQVIVK